MHIDAGGKKKGSSPRGSPAFGSSRAAEPKLNKTGIGLPAARKVNFIDTIKTEISKALIGLHVGKQYEIDQVLEDLRFKGS